MKTAPLVLLALTLLASVAPAQDRPKSREEAEALAANLKYQTGEISLRDGLATLRVPEGWRFLNGADANTVLVRLWGNPPQDEPLGMLMPEGSPLSAESWAVIVSYEEDGFVKDEDAGKIDYGKLLKEMQTSTRDGNKAREKAGYSSIDLVGWAAPPRYDQTAKKLHWAKELKFGDAEENTLNYDIRLLGRRGVLILSAVASMSQFAEIEAKTPAILAAVDFNPGNRYADFNEASGDKVAKYGIGALVAGGVAAKLGFFKGLWIAALGAKKFIIIGVVALAALVRKLLANRSAGRITERTAAEDASSRGAS